VFALQRHLSIIQQAKARIQSRFYRMAAQDLGAKTVDGADVSRVQPFVDVRPERIVPVILDVEAHLLSHAVAHLTSGPQRKGDRDDMAQAHALFKQTQVSPYQRPRLAGARPRGDHNVALPHADGLRLLWPGIEAVNDRARYHRAS